MTHVAQSDSLVNLPCRALFFVLFNAFLVVPVDLQDSFSACHSQGFGCRAALQRSMRLTMTIHYVWVCKLKACVAAKGGFFRVAQTWQTASCHSKTQRTNLSFNTSFDHSMARPQAQTAPQTQTTPTFPKRAPPDPQEAPGSTLASQKSLHGPLGSELFFERPASGGKHSLKMKGAHFEKCTFVMCTFPEAKSKFVKHMLETTCSLKEIHWVI